MFSTNKKQPIPYTCQCCFKVFKRKYYYDRHTLWCERQWKSMDRDKLDTITELPTQHHMFEMILDIKNKLAIIEKRVNNNISTENTNKRKMYTELCKQDMSSIKPGCEFTSFFKELVIMFSNATKMLSHQLDVDGRGASHGIGYGITEFLVDYVEIYTNAAMSSDTNGDALIHYPLLYRSKILYVFSDGIWKIMSYKSFNTIINIITAKLLNIMQEAFNSGVDGLGSAGGGGGGGGGNSFDIDICFQSIGIDEYMEYTQKLMYDVSSNKFSEKYIKYFHNKLLAKMDDISVQDVSLSFEI